MSPIQFFYNVFWHGRLVPYSSKSLDLTRSLPLCQQVLLFRVPHSAANAKSVRVKALCYMLFRFFPKSFFHCTQFCIHYALWHNSEWMIHANRARNGEEVILAYLMISRHWLGASETAVYDINQVRADTLRKQFRAITSWANIADDFRDFISRNSTTFITKRYVPLYMFVKHRLDGLEASAVGNRWSKRTGNFGTEINKREHIHLKYVLKPVNSTEYVIVECHTV
jgi:hypothetical protein